MPRGPKGEHRPADVIGNTVRVMRSTPEEGKDPAAVALGRKGGKARAEGIVRQAAERDCQNGGKGPLEIGPRG